MATNKGFIKDFYGNKLLPITRAELVLDADGKIALHSDKFLAHFDDEQGDIPGLITAKERQLIESSNGNVSDLYNKVEYINSGLSFNNTAVNFYNAQGATPIDISATNGIAINVISDSNKYQVSLGLQELTAISKTSTILKGITVDRFGRVTEVTDGTLSNAEIPDLNGKTITNSTLTGCTTENLTDTSLDNAIANKKYVDDRFTSINTIATGALKFGGSVDENTTFSNILVKSNLNKYYKSVSNITLSASQVYRASSDVLVKSGDSLIVYQEGESGAIQFVHIPSGDDITSITILNDADKKFDKQIGAVTFNFASPFSVSGTNTTATISINQARALESGGYQGGYISAEDYQRFSQYAAKSVAYTPTVTAEDLGSYEIGKLNFGDTDIPVYGKYAHSNLSLENGSTEGTDAQKAINPKLKFTESGQTDVNIQIVGDKGILAKKNGTSIEISTNNEVANDSTSYLSINAVTNESAKGYRFGVKLGSVDNNFSVTDGLASVELVKSMITGYAVNFEFVSKSLSSITGTSDDTYYYGSNKLKNAITVENI